ncbi:hypothetical protein [Vulgatibacter sp.]|uniref:hypothetical protein n=1 Tax=Vulgatibacter sp. TaxID=1971226 RepID=UPI0035680E5B
MRRLVLLLALLLPGFANAAEGSPLGKAGTLLLGGGGSFTWSNWETPEGEALTRRDARVVPSATLFLGDGVGLRLEPLFATTWEEDDRTGLRSDAWRAGAFVGPAFYLPVGPAVALVAAVQGGFEAGELEQQALGPRQQLGSLSSFRTWAVGGDLGLAFPVRQSAFFELLLEFDRRWISSDEGSNYDEARSDRALGLRVGIILDP